MASISSLMSRHLSLSWPSSSTAMEAATDPDPEKDSQEEYNTVGGYERTARLMGDVPDLAIFRSYLSLSAESLLHYQAELRDAELKLAEIRTWHKTASPESLLTKYDHDSALMRDGMVGSIEPGQDPSAQWRQMQHIRRLMREYHEALVLHQKVANITRPKQGQLNSLKEWMERPTMGNIKLIGNDWDIWEKSKTEELVSLARTSPDNATWTWNLSMKVLTLYHHLIGSRIHKRKENDEEEEHLRNTILYQERSLLRGVVIIKGLVACLLPIGAIVVLNAVKSMSARLGVIAAFTAVFSLAIGSLTSATLKDIFSATAAFSAVLVVFVGTTDQHIERAP